MMDHSKQFVCAKHQENKNEQTEKVKLYVSSKKFTDSMMFFKILLSMK